MKKLFTLVAAALMAVGVNAQTEELYVSSGNPAWYQATVANVSTLENFHIDFRSKWSVYQLVDATNPISLADYKGVKIEYAIDPTSTTFINLNVQDKQYSGLPANETSTIIPFTVADITEVTAMCLQQADAGKASIDVKSISLVKVDDTEVPLTACGTNCYNNTAYKSCTLKFAGWGSQGILKNENGEDLTFDPTGKLSYKYEIQFEEALPFGVALSLNYKDAEGKDANLRFSANSGDTQLVADVNSESCHYSILNIGIVGFSDQSIKIASIKRTTIDPTGVEKVEVAKAGSDFVNVAGQKVSKNYKGLVIDRASGRKIMK